DPISHRRRPPPGDLVQVARAHPGDGKVLRKLPDVLTGVAVLGRLTPLHSSGDRLGEPAYLAADVVEQVLPLDIMSRQLQEPSERVPVRRAPPAGHRQRARRIGRDELDQDSLWALRGPPPELI